VVKNTFDPSSEAPWNSAGCLAVVWHSLHCKGDGSEMSTVSERSIRAYSSFTVGHPTPLDAVKNTLSPFDEIALYPSSLFAPPNVVPQLLICLPSSSTPTSSGLATPVPTYS